MAVVTTYHVVCDGCSNYAGWNPWGSCLEATTAARRLGWEVKTSESKTYPGTQNVAAKCPPCLARAATEPNVGSGADPVM